MSTFTATYSPDDNKLRLYASDRLETELYKRVRAAGFIWAPKQDLFVAPMWTPDREDLAIELAGEIGDDDQTLTERAEDRAERFETYSDNREEDAERAHAAVDAIAQGIPLGQPILVGHHSERHARRDAEKIENGMRRAIKLWETSKYWERRAQGAIRHAKYKELPGVRARRIKGIEADKRVQERFTAHARRYTALWTAPDLTLEQAIQIANTDGGYWSMLFPFCRPGETEPYHHGPCSLWDALNRGIPVEDVKAKALQNYTRSVARAERWIAHYNNRLLYENTMLAEQGATHLLAKRPKSAKAQLPLLNYRAPEGIACLSPWRRGETITYPQIDMSAAEYAKLYVDYKGTRITEAEPRHRVRIAILRQTWSVVFITDSKAHARPTAPTPPPPEPEPAIEAATEVSEPSTFEEHQADDPHCTCNDCVQDHADRLEAPEPASAEPTINDSIARDYRATGEDRVCPDGAGCPVESCREERTNRGIPVPPVDKFEAMRASLKAGVQVVSAPQLFPTPPAVGAIVMQWADVRPGQRILEPSAGTGALVDLLPDGAHVVAVEISNALCRRLNTHPKIATVLQADFLDFAGADVGAQFDRVVMNPPFVNGADIKHIERAYTLLKPGGRLVAVCANGPRQREKLQEREETTAWIDLPAGSFAPATNVNTAIVVLDKPEA